MREKRFSNEQLLVSTEWLVEHLDDPEVRIVEVTPPGAGYTLSHIRGAVFLNLDAALPGLDVPVDQAAAQLGQLGLAPDKMIVIYDEIGGQRAAQAFWLMEYLGFARVSIVEGGCERWIAEGRPETRVVPKVTPTTFIPNLRAERLATADWIAAHLSDEGVLLADCRTSEEYAEGHIPGARNRNWERTLVLRAHQQFRDAVELEREFAELGASDGRELVTYCGSGTRSAHTYFTLRLLGYASVRNYKGSWDEWQTRADLPKAQGN